MRTPSLRRGVLVASLAVAAGGIWAIQRSSDPEEAREYAPPARAPEPAAEAVAERHQVFLDAVETRTSGPRPDMPHPGASASPDADSVDALGGPDELEREPRGWISPPAEPAYPRGRDAEDRGETVTVTKCRTEIMRRHNLTVVENDKRGPQLEVVS